MTKILTVLQIILKQLNPSNQTLLYERKSLCNVNKKNNKWKVKKENKTTLACKGILPVIFASGPIDFNQSKLLYRNVLLTTQNQRGWTFLPQ